MDTTTINLRNIPNDMAKRAKSRAALEGVSLKDFCMAAIAQAVIDSEKGGENHAGVEQGNVSRNLSVTSFQAVVGEAHPPKTRKAKLQRGDK